MERIGIDYVNSEEIKSNVKWNIEQMIANLKPYLKEDIDLDRLKMILRFKVSIEKSFSYEDGYNAALQNITINNYENGTIKDTD